MGFLDFLKHGLVRLPEPKVVQPRALPTSAPGDLIFKSSVDVLEHVKEFAPLAWQPNVDLLAMVGGEVILKGEGDLCVVAARVLAPKDDGFAQLTTFNTIRAVHSREKGRQPVNRETIDLKHGDLVTIHLVERNSELVNLNPHNYDGWVAFITAKMLPIFSVKDGGWRIERKYEF
jgi:hypothetical protein